VFGYHPVMLDAQPSALVCALLVLASRIDRLEDTLEDALWRLDQ
jgi:hypothetical protein